MEVLHCRGTEHPLYQSVQTIRRDGSEIVSYDFDQYSNHYVLFSSGLPLGTLTVHEARAGELDCQPFYPQRLLRDRQDQVAGACKMRIRRGATAPIEALRSLIRGAWLDLVERGIRVTIANSEPRLSAFYRRIGFSYIPGYDFVHPQLGTASQVLIMAADPDHRSYCQDDFSLVTNPVSQREIIQLCDRSHELADVA